MYINKNFSFLRVIRFTGGHIIWLTAWAFIIAAAYEYTSLGRVKIPWLPLSVIGIAVAFYVGFKNNSSYDRLWEARKIWGSIVNSSRSWGTTIRSFVSNQFTIKNESEALLYNWHKKLIFRHIGWLYTLRNQLLIPTSWEHINQGKFIRKATEKRMKEFGVGLIEDEITKMELQKCLQSDEYQRLINYQNTATQIIDQQSQDLKELRKLDLIDDFRHMELQKMLKRSLTYC